MNIRVDTRQVSCLISWKHVTPSKHSETSCTRLVTKLWSMISMFYAPVSSKISKVQCSIWSPKPLTPVVPSKRGSWFMAPRAPVAPSSHHETRCCSRALNPTRHRIRTSRLSCRRSGEKKQVWEKLLCRELQSYMEISWQHLKAVSWSLLSYLAPWFSDVLGTNLYNVYCLWTLSCSKYSLNDTVTYCNAFLWLLEKPPKGLRSGNDCVHGNNWLEIIGISPLQFRE